MVTTLDRQGVIAQAAGWMQARGWKEKLAKRRGYEQSLFEHSLIELDVMLELFLISKRSGQTGGCKLSQKVEFPFFTSGLSEFRKSGMGRMDVVLVRRSW